jgi:hypothetical protein
MDPLSGTVPIPLSIAAEMAFEVVHVRVEEPPETTVAGAAEMFTVGLAAKIMGDARNNTINTTKTNPFFSCIDYSLD